MKHIYITLYPLVQFYATIHKYNEGKRTKKKINHHGRDSPNVNPSSVGKTIQQNLRLISIVLHHIFYYYDFNIL